MPDTTRWLNTVEMARRLGVTRWEISKLAREGVLHGILLPGRAGWRFPPEELDRLLQEQVQERTAASGDEDESDDEPEPVGAPKAEPRLEGRVYRV
jgi:excisionase family DNA binding protein